MGFATELKTVMKLDDSDWKKALESVKKVEKEYFKESKVHTQKLMDLEDQRTKQKYKNASQEKTLKDAIAKQDTKMRIAMENGNKKEAQLARDKIKVLKSIASIKTTANKAALKQINDEISATKRLSAVQTNYLKFVRLRKQNALDLQKETQKSTVATTANTKAKNLNAKSTENLANQTIRYLRWAGTIAGVIYAANRAWDATLGIGIQVNKMMEDNTSGIAALLSANTQMTLSNGQVVNSYEKFKIGQEVAAQTMDDLRKASIKTYATFPQLTEIFQQAIGQTLSMGDAFGSSTDEIIDNTIKLTQSLSNIAGAIGMPMDRVREEIRSMLSGNASTDSLISTMLFGSPGEANQAIRDAKARGKDGLTDVLREMLKPFDALSDVDSYTRSLLQLEDAWSQAMAGMSKPVFEDLKVTFKELAVTINDSKEEIQEGFETFYETAKEIVPVIGRIGVGVGAIRIAAMVNPFTAWAVTLASIVGALQDVSEELTKQRHEASVKGIVSATSGGITTASTSAEAVKAQQAIEGRILGFSRVTEKNVLDRNLKTMQALADEWNRLQGVIDGSTKKVENFTAVGELVTKMGIDSDIAKKAAKYAVAEETKLGKLKKSLQEYEAEIIRINKETEKIPGGVPTETQQAVIASALKIQTDAIKKSKIEIAAIELKERQKILKSEQDLWVMTQRVMGVEVEKSQIAKWELNALGEQLAIEDDITKQNKLQELIMRQVLMLQKEETKEKEKIDTTYYDVMSDSYISMLDSQVSLAESTNDWANNLEGVAANIVGVSNAFAKLRVNELKSTEKQAKLDKKFTKNWIKLHEAKEDTGELEKQHLENTNKLKDQEIDNTINGYGQISAAMSQMFDEGSREAAAFQAIESGLAVVAGVRAILTAGTGDPYTAIPRMIAMAAMVATTLGQAGIAFKGESSVSESYDTFSAQEANIGTGSVLGDAEAQSESMQNSLSILEDFAKPEFELMSQMTASLKTIEYALAGVSANILKTAGFSIGEGFTATSSYQEGLSSFESEALTYVLTSGANELTDVFVSTMGATFGDNLGVSLLGDINTAIGGLAGDFFGGGTKTTATISDAGLRFDAQLITTAITDLIGSEYQTIKTTIEEDGGWFSSDSTTIKYQTYYEALDAELESQFQLILGSLYNTMLISGEMLDTSTTVIADELSDFYVELGKISLKGKTGEEIEEELTAIFGKVGDEMAREAFPALEAFQQIGEGLFETLTRVSVGMEEAEYYINKLGYAFNDVVYTDIINQQGVVAVEVLKQSIVEYDEALYGSSNGVVDMVSLISTSASELFETYEDLSEIRNQLEFIGYSTDSLTSSMVLGADGIESLSTAMEDYYENFLTEEEQFIYQTQSLTDEFEKLNLSLPESKDAFTELLESIDLTTESGQELWGRVILLSDGFTELSDAQEDFYDSALEGVLSLSAAFESLGESIDETIETLLGNQTGADSQDALISSYWTKRSELDLLLAKDGDLTTSEQAKLTTLVGDINTLSLGIQGAEVGDTTLITESLVSELSGIKTELDFDNQILNVRIVEFKDAFGIAIPAEEVGVLSALPSYDVGSPYIQYDQTAQIHRGEMVVDADFSSKLRRYGIPQPVNNTMTSEGVLLELKQISAKLGQIEKTSALSSSILDESQYEQRTLSVKVIGGVEINGIVQTETA